jgi:hypothetical protein
VTDVAIPAFPLLEVVAFVDATTVILVGPHVEGLREGDELYVLGIGQALVPKTNIPLISPKANLVVTFPAGRYALARSPETQQKWAGAYETLVQSLSGSATTVTRRKLTSDEGQFLGDPGKEPMRIGDQVIKKSDLGAFIRFWTEREGATKK